MNAKGGHKQWNTKSSKLYRSALEPRTHSLGVPAEMVLVGDTMSEELSLVSDIQGKCSLA